MRDLSIKSLEIDQTEIREYNPEDQIWKLGGFSSQYDFHLLVRSVLFFLEEKTPIVWDPIAQVEIFRILFLNAYDALELAELASEIQAIDTIPTTACKLKRAKVA